MIPALGRGLLLLALLAAVSGSVVAFATGARPTALGWRLTRWLAYAFGAFMTLANALMVYALLARDFSVSYVAQVGSRSIPDWVAVVSLWSSLEGSILFWGFVLGAYVAGATFVLRDRHPEYMPWAVGTWLLTSGFFALLLAGPSQPFNAAMPVPTDGPGPNPLLQNHLLMAIHPPFLYLGYIGMTIPFGLACAALLRGRLGHDLLRPLRTSLLLPWVFLSVAIVLGGWWAYEVLGWGGYWAWDPVENASFLPWLTATAALHSAILTERKGVLKGWTTTLVIATYLLTLLGTFMTRSGVFNSVHSFTQSDIGPTILAFLTLVLLLMVVLLAFRLPTLGTEGRLDAGGSRDVMFLVNNLLLVLFTFTVLVGTVFPLVVEALQDRQMSVGRPYFDRMSVPIGVGLLLLMGIGPALPWGAATVAQVRAALLPPLLGGALFVGIGAALGVRNGWTLVTLLFGGFTAQVTLRELWRPVRHRMAAGEGVGTAFLESQLLRGRRRLGGYLVHASIVLITIAIAVSSTMQTSKELVLRQGESATVGPYTLTYLGPETRSEPHRQSLVARVGVKRGERDLGVLEPRMNHYDTQREPIGTPSVRSSIAEDLYLSIMNVDPQAGTLGLLAMVNPMVGWIWFGTGLLAFGGVLGLLPGLRRPAPAPVVVPSDAVPEGLR